MKKASEIFEGKESSLKKTFDKVADFDLPDVSEDAPKAKPRIHNAGESTCTACEG